MRFHMEEAKDASITGWVLPDNPKVIPSIKVLTPNGRSIQVKANVQRPDLKARGAHDTGMVGFALTKESHADVIEFIDQIEIREAQTNAIIFRRFQKDTHVEQKLFRFELRAMPDPQLESLFAKRFTYAYGVVQRHTQDTFLGIFNNPAAKSIYVSGCPNYQQYEHLLRERGYKIVSLIRNPYEEMAERLLFARYATSPQAPPFVADHILGLKPLIGMVKAINFGDTESIRAAFDSMTPQQRGVLNNPLVRTLVCAADQRPKIGHVAVALSKLSHMDLVGIHSRFGEFKSVLREVLGIDVLESHELTSLSWVQRVAERLPEIKQAKHLVSLDMELYSYAEEAIREALGPLRASENVV
jgi:hypothetical protein